MANWAWLTTAATRQTFPRLQDPKYDARRHTVARCQYGIALLWLPLFRPSDILVEDVAVEGGKTYRDPAPVVNIPMALARLADAVPRLNAIFRSRGPLDRYARLLHKAIASIRRPFITLEAEELAWWGQPEGYYRRLKRALAYFEHEDSPTWRKALLSMTCPVAEPTLPFPDPVSVWDGDDLEAQEIVYFLLGEGYERPVPWKPRR